ncbi:MAG: Lrp/AsnC family transcriptional regulator [Actinomycetota bacterium]
MGQTLDELDIHLLDLLQADARTPFVKLASELDVSDQTVRNRIDRLVHRFGVKFIVDIDPAELGLLFLYVAVRVQGTSLERAIERLSSLPEVAFLSRTTGGYDLIAEVICRDRHHLMRVLDDYRAIPGIVHVDTFNILQVEKENWRFSGLAMRQGSGD